MTDAVSTDQMKVEGESNGGEAAAARTAAPADGADEKTAARESAGSAPPAAPRKSGGVKVDMDSHGGLRGIASIVIMFQHILGETRYKLDSNGSSMLPLFFMLSGFSMAVVYGRRPLARNKLYARMFPGGSGPDGNATSSEMSVINNKEVKNEDLKEIDVMEFYQNRVARVMPTYYLCMLLAVPVAFLGCLSWETDNTKGLIGALVMGTLPVASLLNFFWEIPINGPGWTVQTLLYFWLLTPVWLPEAQRLKTSRLVESITRWFYVQLVIVFVMYPLWKLIPDAGQFGAIGASTMNPVGRFPLFLMGIDAGMLCLRFAGGDGGASGVSDSEDGLLQIWPNKLPLVGNWFPMSSTSPAADGGSTAAAAADVESQAAKVEDEGTQAKWVSLANASGLGVFVSWFVLTMLDSGFRLADRDGHDLHVAGLNLGAGLYCFLWYQAIDPFIYLTLLVSVTKDGGKSLTSRLLRTPVCQFLGKISMAIYLVHMPCIGFFKLMVEGPIWSISSNTYRCWMIHGGPMTLPNGALDGSAGALSAVRSGASIARIACETAWASLEENHDERKFLPALGIGVVPVMAVVAGYLIFIGFEEPLRRHLRKKK